MVDAVGALEELSRSFADVIPTVDREAEHSRWKPGIGPFGEEQQLEMILETLATDCKRPEHIETEVPYPNTGKRCDLVLKSEAEHLPVEAKLLRFRLDNGNIDPNMYKSVFSPFPERSSSSLLTDTKKLSNSGFNAPYGLLGLYYEKNDEEYDLLTAENIAEKFCIDTRYWYDTDIEVAYIAPFEGLQHQHHQRGAVITWVVHE